ncbi:MAG: EAL domain-containing protein [Pseudomonadota bacterium]
MEQSLAPARLPSIDFNAELRGDDLIDTALETIRTHLGMRVAYLSRFDGQSTVFRNVSAPGLEELIKPNDRMRLAEMYCPHINAGRLPNLIVDTRAATICQKLDITHRTPIGSHVSLPILQEDGTVYGMMCCLSPEPHPTLNERDLSVMASFATLVTRQVRLEQRARAEANLLRKEIADLLKNTEVLAVFQPIVQLSDGALIGMEALTRFRSDAFGSAEAMFQQAENVGLGLDLELLTLGNALRAYEACDPAAYLAINASPALICDPRFRSILPKEGLHRLVIEITEHGTVEDESILRTQIAQLQAAKARIAIDDFGTGHSNLMRLSSLSPDIIKIDRSLVADLADRPAQAAVISAIVHFADKVGCKVLGEGVETEQIAQALQDLGVQLAQGWYYGKPAPLIRAKATA